MSRTPRASILGHPRVHLRRATSTNDRARELAIAGAPHGTLVSASEQTAGRGRMGRSWVAPAGSSLLMSLVLRFSPAGSAQPSSERPSAAVPLLAAVAVCDVAGSEARVKWPNDVVVEDEPRPRRLVEDEPKLRKPVEDEPKLRKPVEDGPKPRKLVESGPKLRKLAGILIEGRPQEGWAVLGIGLNVAVGLEDLPPELRETAATLGLAPTAIEPTLAALLGALERRLADPVAATLERWRELDALRGREVAWGSGGSGGSREERAWGHAEGIDDSGRLLVMTAEGQRVALAAGEVSLHARAR